MSTALVTGSHGFVGSHLRQVLRDRGWDVVGLGRADREAAAAAEGERYFCTNLTDTPAVLAALEVVRPDVVFHLAATPALKEAAAPTVTDLVTGTVTATHSLMSAVASTARSRVVHVGSSAQYGSLPVGENPVREDSRCNPVTSYGWAKAAAEATARAFEASGTVDVVPVRAFNIIGAGEPPTTVASAFAGRIAAFLDGRLEQVQARDLSAVRDFTDVRDVAAGLVDLAERGTRGRLYNLCSGRPTTVGDVLDGLLDLAGLDRGVVHVLPDSGPGGVPYQVGSAARARAEVGWSAKIELPESLRALLERVQQGVAR